MWRAAAADPVTVVEIAVAVLECVLVDRRGVEVVVVESGVVTVVEGVTKSQGLDAIDLFSELCREMDSENISAT